MTPRAPGLTAAMRRALEKPAHASVAMLRKLKDAGFIDLRKIDSIYTPRGQAALAAPRMTAAELAALEWYTGDCCGNYEPHGKTITRLHARKFLRGTTPNRELTPAGLTALNNMRAAMGSAEYKETV